MDTPMIPIAIVTVGLIVGLYAVDTTLERLAQWLKRR